MRRVVIYVIGLESSGTRWLSRAIHKCVEDGVVWDGETPACVSTPRYDIFHVSLPWGGWCSNVVPPLYHVDSCAAFQRAPPRDRWLLDVPRAVANPNAKVVVIRRHPRDQFSSKQQHHCRNETTGRRENERGNALIVDAIRAHGERTFVLDFEYMDDGWQWVGLTRFLNVSCRMATFKIPL